MSTVIEFPMASILASEIVCMFTTCEGNFEYISAEVRGGETYKLERVYSNDDDILERFTQKWKNALKNTNNE